MTQDPKWIDITPEKYEEQVKNWINNLQGSLKSFKFKQRSISQGASGEYEIDIKAQFEIFNGAKILILIECKRHKNPIKRDVVMTLESKLRDINAHKAMIFSTSGFQTGASEFADKKNIATIIFQEGKSSYQTRSLNTNNNEPPPWANIPKYAGWFVGKNEKGNQTFSLLDNTRIDPLENWIQK